MNRVRLVVTPFLIVVTPLMIVLTPSVIVATPNISNYCLAGFKEISIKSFILTYTECNSA